MPKRKSVQEDSGSEYDEEPLDSESDYAPEEEEDVKPKKRAPPKKKSEWHNYLPLQCQQGRAYPLNAEQHRSVPQQPARGDCRRKRQWRHPPLRTGVS